LTTDGTHRGGTFFTAFEGRGISTGNWSPENETEKSVGDLEATIRREKRGGENENIGEE